MELDALLELAVERHAVGLKRRNLLEQAGDELVVFVPAKRSLADGLGDRGLAGVRGLLHVHAFLGIGLAEAQDLLLVAGIGRGCSGAATGRKAQCSSASACKGRALEEAAACNALHCHMSLLVLPLWTFRTGISIWSWQGHQADSTLLNASCIDHE